MDGESIIWVIIFLIYFASTILKRIRRTSKPKEQTAAKMHSGWKERLTRFQNQVQDKLGGFLNQIQQEVEPAKQKASKKETGWEKFLPPKDDEPEPAAKITEMMAVSPKPSRTIVKEDATFQDVEPMRQEVIFQRVAQPVKTVPAFKPKPSAVKDVVEKKEPVDSEKEILETGLAYGIQDLRRAVIWSEILAPPLALRDE
jgi:hypothetical protein